MPFTLPGEMVEAEPRDKRGEGIAAELVEVLAPSRHREPPPCAHFKVCGGCALQHWRRDAYTAWKVDLIARALAQRGVDGAALRAASDRRAGRAAARRLRAAPAGQARAGRLPRAREPRESSMSAVCVIARPTLGALLEPLRTAAASILPDGAAADAVVNETDSGIDLLLRPHKRLDLSLERREALVALAERADLARLSWGDRASAEPVVVRRAPLLLFGEARVEPPPGAFLQATKRAEQAMRAAVADWAGDAPRLADLFAGVGALSIGRPGKVALFESDKPAVAAAEAAARRLGGQGDRRTPRPLPQSADSGGARTASTPCVLDPPRAGAAAQIGRAGALEGAARGLRLVRSRHLRARRARSAGRRIPAGETAADRPVPVVARMSS